MKPQYSNRLAFQEIFQKHRKDALQYLLGLTKDQDIAEDLTQEAFIRVHRYFDRYNPEKGPCINWILIICRNVFYDYCKKQKLNNHDALDEIDETQFITQEDPASITEKKFIEQQLHQLIQNLPTQQRNIVLLKYIQQKQSPEIAEILGVSERTVRRNFVKALEFLKKDLKAKGLNVAVLYK